MVWESGDLVGIPKGAFRPYFCYYNGDGRGPIPDFNTAPRANNLNAVCDQTTPHIYYCAWAGNYYWMLRKHYGAGGAQPAGELQRWCRWW